MTKFTVFVSFLAEVISIYQLELYLCYAKAGWSKIQLCVAKFLSCSSGNYFVITKNTFSLIKHIIKTVLSEAVARRCPVKNAFKKDYVVFTGKHLRRSLF